MTIAREEMERAFREAGLTVFERGWLSCNNVLFRGGLQEETVLVDSGYWSHAEQTVALVRSALQEGSLDRVLNTHLHSDHCGGNHALQRAFGCKVDVPASEAAKVDAWDEDRLTFRDTGQYCPRFERHGVLCRGQAITLGGLPWQVLAAPGHDPESVVLHQSELKLLISADALWENGFGVVFPEIEGEQAFGDVAWTLNQISILSIDWVIPGHGPPFGNVPAAIRRARSRLDGFVAAPDRHARHAAKVLMKFHLLEHQRMHWQDLSRWMLDTRYLHLLHNRYFSAEPFDNWAQLLLQELVGVGALRMRNGVVCNA